MSPEHEQRLQQIIAGYTCRFGPFNDIQEHHDAMEEKLYDLIGDIEYASYHEGSEDIKKVT